MSNQNFQEIVSRLVDSIGDEAFVLAAFEPTPDNYTGADDKADIYAIVSKLEADGGVLVYGYSRDRDEWVANWSSRHALRYLIDTISLIKVGWSIHDVSKTIEDRMNGNQFGGNDE